MWKTVGGRDSNGASPWRYEKHGGQTLVSGEERTSDIDRENIVAEDKGSANKDALEKWLEFSENEIHRNQQGCH